MSAPHFTRARSREAFEAIARHVAGGESSYARLRAGQELVIDHAAGAWMTQAAVRLARAVTGREVVITFEGHCHGWADPLAAGIGAGSVARPARPNSPAIPGADEIEATRAAVNRAEEEIA